MHKLIQQIVKFGFVGVIATCIDFAIYTGCNAIGIPYLISGFLGFSISLIFNYFASMKYVFTRRTDLSRQKEFAIFLGLSFVGLLLNELFLYICMDLIYLQSPTLRVQLSKIMAETLAKIIATSLVMVYNFVSRKLVLEKK